MKAIILAAGYGRRMHPLTADTHKALLRIGNDTIIDRIVDSLIENQVTDVVVVTGYRSESLRDHLLQQFPNVQFTFVHNERYETTNNIFSLALAFESITIDSDVLLIECDLIMDSSIIRKIVNTDKPNVALVDRYRQGMDGTVVTVDGGVISNVIPPHLQPEDFDFRDKFKTLNVYRFSQEFACNSFRRLLIHYARAIDNNCYYELILGILIYMQKEVIHALEVDAEDRWAEVDDPNDLRTAAFVFNEDSQLNALQDAFGGYWNYDVLDFAFIRNMHFPTGSVLSELKSNLVNLLHNYGSRQSILNEKMAYFVGCEQDNIQALNGASQIYPFLHRLFNQAPALVPKPSFGEYDRVFPNALRYDDSGEFDLDELRARVDEVDVVVFVNPNNPTGTTVATEWIERLARENSKTTFIIDESFIEFTDQPSIIPALEQNPASNVIVLKSLSKNLGVPGVRLGYVFSQDPFLMKRVREETPVWNLNSIAEYYLEILLKHRGTLESSYTKTIEDREAFCHELSRQPAVAHVYPSGGNFVLARLAGDPELAAQLTEQLLVDHKILVKDISSKFDGDSGYLRLAVRTPEDHQVLISSLEECYQKITSPTQLRIKRAA